MSLVRALDLPVLLGFERNPACSPQRCFIVGQDALCPFRWHWFALLGLMPLTQPYDVLRRGWNLANGAEFGLAIFFDTNGPLDPCPQVGFVLPRDGADQLSVDVPVDACHQVLMVFLAG